MYVIQLHKDGSLGDARGPIDGSPLSCLSCRIELGKGYLLRSFFQMIDRYAELGDISAFFPDYMEQLKRCPASGCTAAGFDFLEFSKTVEMIGFPGDPRLEIYPSLKGRRKSETLEIASSRLEGLLDLPVRLGRLKHVVFGDKVDVFEFDTVFNLFEFIDGIAWELSFHGTSDACAIRR